MKVVSIEWFEQSLERGMVLDESLFHPTMAVEERGKGAWDRVHAISPSLGKRPRDADQGQALNPFRRKLRRSASTKMGSQSEALWAGITAASFDIQQEDEDDWTETSVRKQDDTRASTPAIRTADATTPLDNAPAPMDPAEVRKEGSLLPNGHSHDGLFEGRVVCPYGFDGKKVCCLLAVF